MAISYNGLWKQLIDHGMKKEICVPRLVLAPVQ